MDVVYKRIPDSLLAILARPLLITARGSWDFQIGDLSDRSAPRQAVVVVTCRDFSVSPWRSPLPP